MFKKVNNIQEFQFTKQLNCKYQMRIISHSIDYIRLVQHCVMESFHGGNINYRSAGRAKSVVKVIMKKRRAKERGSIFGTTSD